MAEQDRDQRTEQPTPQRLQRALEEGQVGVSSELLGSCVLAVGTVFFLLMGSWFFATLAVMFKDRSTYFQPAIIDPQAIRSLIALEIGRVSWILLALLLPTFLVALIVGGLQTNFNISFKPLEMKWDKLSITKGFGRIFSVRSLIRGLMAVLKAAGIIGLACLITYWQFDQIATSGYKSFPYLMLQIGQILLYVAIAAAAMMMILGVADLAFQKYKHVQDLRMSIRDIRDEHKESEGDPLIRARVKRLQNEIGRQRMVQQVARASVVITNPTRFAVALEYDRQTMIAPKVIAKGTEQLAQRIIQMARENGVPIVERKPVARFLYFNVKIGQFIPAELYEAVAEVLNYIRRLRLDRRSIR